MVKIIHNPRCSKSRQTLALLQENNIPLAIIDYLNKPLNATEIQSVLKKLQMNARDLLRKSESAYKELGLSDVNKSEDELIKAMVSHPKLIQRPIVINGDKAAIGRPPESVLEIV